MANENTIQATGTFVTRKGLSLITKLVAANGELTFSRAAVGTGKPPEGYSPESMINLAAYRMDAELSEYGVRDDKAYVTLQVSSEHVEDGFLLTEVGVYAQDPDEGEILYAYMDVSTDPTYIYANGVTNRSKFAEFTLYVLIGSVERVTAAVVPGSIITREVFDREKVDIIIMKEDIPIANRKAKSFYLKVSDRQSMGTLTGIKVGPNMGIKLI